MGVDLGPSEGPGHLGNSQGLEGLLGLGGLNPLAGTSVDNPLASYTEGGDFDPRAHAGARHVLEGMVEIGHGGNASARARDANDYASPAPAASHGYESLGLVGAHFPGTPPRVAGLAAPKPSPSSVVAAARRPARGAGAAGAGIGPDGPPLGPGARKAGAAGDKAARSSQFRGVTKHRRSGRFEAHIWVKDLGRQVYLGGYECEEHAAEAYDIAALKCKGRRGCKTNFDLTKYADLLGCINRMTMEELVMAVRRQSQGFSRGTSSFRGVTHHPSGRWEARIGVPGSKHIYLGLFIEEREAAKAYDRALVRLRGRGAATNFALGGSSENIGGGMLLPAPAGSESKTPMPCPSYSHATASSGQH
ncbi:AP2-like ethylene-responsive transcription factor PLT2 [Auxenochlorella protothecoides]|uniref:AP2-like ethylene-responsive transcription factor PLT2 n=1 Tax=Auxenochlorella protothecoides TaxID=3075 RepID=A0A087SBN7_AUXPR|nr:AP2-like ethylene-responsive transcription factor PLT2 [Auxenochlorella protothecoides]KFM23141.1 AP2-like ethylene-responsive transcription factor PLT2 [Auxenochlorella protothecoides]